MICCPICGEPMELAHVDFLGNTVNVKCMKNCGNEWHIIFNKENNIIKMENCDEMEE